MLELLLEQAGTFEDVFVDGERIVAYGVGPDDDALAFAVSGPDAATVFGKDEQPSGATFPKPQAEREYTGSVLHHRSDVERITLRDVNTTFPFLQPLPDGEILLVGARAARREDGSHDLNGRVYDRDGDLRREFLLGDGIEDVQATADGHIWVSYFDEGIYGNLGWGEPGGPEPIGAPGLIRWWPDGTIEWTYDPPSGVNYIADCYALNVARDEVWACYYTEFPLIRIALDGSITSWHTPTTGARSLAVGGGRAAFYGGYGEDANRCLLLELGNGKLVELASARLMLPSGTPFTGEHVVGRGPLLHAFDGPRWYKLDVRAVALE